MPEGDTIWRAAARMKPALEGKTLARFEASRLVADGPIPGTPIDGVEARGKYLLVHFGDGTTLETHMKMTGSWHLYRTGERWRRSASSARAVIETTEGWLAVCFNAPVVELMNRRTGPDHLGPDLTSPDPDLDEAVRRFEIAPIGTPIAVALLDQRICCGVGNVYKSEVLHSCELDPRVPVEAVPHGLRECLVQTAHRLLRANLGSGPRVTVPGGLAVYGKRGKACPRCGHGVERIVQGEHVRSTYWCPGCQLPDQPGPLDQPGPGRTRPEL